MSPNQPVFDGFLPPTENWSKLPHALIEALPLIETIGELKVILYILRHTWGYHETEKRISQDEFVNGRRRQDGTRLDPGTGLTRNTVKDGIRRAVDHGFIVVEIDDHDSARIQHLYRLAEFRADGQSLTPSADPDGQKLTPRGSELDPPSEPDGQDLTIVHGKKLETKKQTTRKINSGASAPVPNPAQEQLERMREKFGDDPFEVGLTTLRAQEQAGGRGWTIPTQAGGTDGVGPPMLRAWLEGHQLDPACVPDKTLKKLQASLSKLASSIDVDPDQAALAVEIVLDRENPEFSYYTYADPAVAKFKTDWTIVALRLLSGQPGYLTVQHTVPGQYDDLINE